MYAPCDEKKYCACIMTLNGKFRLSTLVLLSLPIYICLVPISDKALDGWRDPWIYDATSGKSEQMQVKARYHE